MPIRYFPHLGHFAAASRFCPGKRKRPNMANTTMPTKNSMTTLTITRLQPETRELRAVLDGGDGILGQCHPEARQ